MRICVIAAIHAEQSHENQSEEVGHWRLAAMANCVSVVSALVKSQSLTTVITSSLSGSVFVKKLKHFSTEKLITGYRFSSCKELASSLKGFDGVVLITDTNFEREQPVTDEVNIGCLVTDASLAAHVPHVIFFTSMHVQASIGLRSDPCDAKAHIADYMDEKNLPRTLLVTPLLYEDFLNGILRPQKTSKVHVVTIAAPMGYIPLDMIGMEDIGICAKNVFTDPHRWLGKTVSLSGDKMTVKEYAQIMTDEAYPVVIKVDEITPDDFMELHQWPGSEDFANYCDYLTRDMQRKNNETTLSLCKDAESFYDWSKKHKNQVKALCQ